jgi:hypothetical protein
VKPIEELSDEEMKQFLKNRGFEDDEIQVSFPKTEDLRKGVADMLKLQEQSDDDDDKFGFDAEDKTELTVEQKHEVRARQMTRDERLKRLKEIEEEKKGIKLENSIEAAGNKVKPEEVRRSMQDIAKLLSGD